MPVNGWTSVIALDDLVDGKAKRMMVDDAAVLVVRSGERVFAIGNRCTHQGAPLDRGPVRISGSSATVTCTAHGSVFRLEDGGVARGPAVRAEPSFETRIVEGAVELRLRT